ECEEPEARQARVAAEVRVRRRDLRGVERQPELTCSDAQALLRVLRGARVAMGVEVIAILGDGDRQVPGGELSRASEVALGVGGAVVAEARRAQRLRRASRQIG